MRKVKIKRTNTSGSDKETSAKMFNGIQQNWPTVMNQFSQPNTEVNNTLKPVDKEDANLEAEKGERAIINQQGITTNFGIGGKRHSEGGTPLNLPSNSFIFSDTKDMKIKDPTILSQFGIGGGSSTPADIAKKYDINRYRKTLADPDSTDLERDTAEMMIANYNLKLAKLALVQESKKGFPQGIPSIAIPYIESMSINPAEFVNTQSQPTPFNPDMVKFGGSYQTGGKTDMSTIDKWVKEAEEKKAHDALMKQFSLMPNWLGLPEGSPEVVESFLNFSKKKQAEDKIRSEAEAKKKSAQYAIDDASKKLKASDAEITTLLKQMESRAKAPSWVNLGIGPDVEDYKNLIVKERNKQLALQKDIDKLKTQAKKPKHYKTQAEYEADLLSPYSNEKRMAQIDWITNNPLMQKTVLTTSPSTQTSNIPSISGAALNEIFPVNTPVDVVQPDTVYKKAVKNPYLKDGGLVEFQKAGTVTVTNYDDGTSSIVDPKTGVVTIYNKPGGKGAVIKTVNPKKKSTQSTSEFEAYPGVAELEKQLVPNAMLRKGKVSTKQHETGKGTGVYGDAEISVDQFIKNNPKFAAEFAKKHPGETYNPKNASHVEEFQNFYNPNLKQSVYDRAKKMGKSDEEANKLADAMVDAYGFKTGSKAREFDKKHGQFTGSRVELEFAEPEQPKTETQVAGTNPAAEQKKEVERKALATTQQPGHDPWWLQDIVKTAGAAGDFFRVKKYSPWQATPGVSLPDPTFYDPSRELAANAEFANIGAQGQMAFTNPQAFAAAYSAIQGQGAKNAADILGRYNNLNVGVANDFEIKRNDIMNQAAANRAGLATQLADKYTILNQQFDNSKNMARQNLRQSYIDAVTNKNYTGNLNDLYEQYKIDPSTGGRIRWTHGRPVTPEDTSKEDMFNKFSELRQKFPTTVSDESIWKYITGERGT